MRPGTKYFLAKIAGAGDHAECLSTTREERHRHSSRAGLRDPNVRAAPSCHRVETSGEHDLCEQGAFDTRRGRLGIAISAASWVALLHLHRIAPCSGKVLKRALAHELGPAYRDAFHGAPIPPLDRETRGPTLEFRVDIVYGDSINEEVTRAMSNFAFVLGVTNSALYFTLQTRRVLSWPG